MASKNQEDIDAYEGFTRELKKLLEGYRGSSLSPQQAADYLTKIKLGYF
jgi:hypothetical protein